MSFIWLSLILLHFALIFDVFVGFFSNFFDFRFPMLFDLRVLGAVKHAHEISERQKKLQ